MDKKIYKKKGQNNSLMKGALKWKT